MSRYERRMYFERLCTLRDAYAAAADEDRTPVMSIDDAVAWIWAEMLDETMLHPVDAVGAEPPNA